MKLQRFVGKNTKSVLDEIRSILGEEALIVSNTKVGSKTEIIAASEALKLDSQSTGSDHPQSKRAPEHGDSFASVMESQREKEAETQAPDPWGCSGWCSARHLVDLQYTADPGLCLFSAGC